MTLEHGLLLGAGVFFVACLAYSLRGGKAPSLQSLQSFAAPLRSKHPIRAAFDAIEEDAKETATKLMAEEIAQHYASEYRSKIQGALGPKAPPINPSSSS
jgi:hypothetical protein